jgi:hypothetical protein
VWDAATEEAQVEKMLHGILARRARVSAALLALSIMARAFGASPEEESSGKPLASDAVVLRRVVDSSYAKQAEFDLSRLSQTSLDKFVVVQDGETVSHIIARLYRIADYTSAAYKSFEKAIVAKNRLLTADKVPAGIELSVPDLPAATAPDAQRIATERIPKCVQSRFGLPTCGYDFRAIRIAVDPIVIQRRAVSDADAHKLTATLESKYEVEAAPLSILFAAADAPSVSNLLSTDERSEVMALLSRAAIKPVPLFVLDDAWPDSQSFIESRAYLLDAIRIVRQKFKMGATSLRPAFASMPLGPMVGGTPSSATHAAKIKDALAPLAALDPARAHVQVVFVPLFRLQAPAQELLTEIVSIHLMARDMRAVLGIDEVPEDIRTRSLTLARQYVGRISNTGDTTLTDQVVVEALVWFARHLSQTTQRPFLMNLSWTVPNLQFQLALPADAIGLVAVAAGNDLSRVMQSRTQLAYRSSFPRDVLAVMNVDAGGAPACSSSLLETDGGSSAVAFSGWLSATTCGTSFASPRVAWLIAAREAVRSVDPNRIWVKDLLDELAALRDATKPDFNKIRFDVARFYSKEINHAGD